MNRTLVALLAFVALIFVILGAAVVLTADQGGTTTATPPVAAAKTATAREHTRVERGLRGAAEPAALVLDVAPLPEPERLPTVTGSGFLQGSVADAVTAEAMQGVVVRLLHPTGEQIARTESDHAGRYSFEGVPEEIPLLVEFGAPGYLTGYCCDLELQPTEIARKDASLLRAPRVTVAVRAMPWERAAADVRVRITDEGREIAAGFTDALGRIELPVPEFGDFELRVGGGEWAPTPALDIRLMPGAGDVEERADVQRGGGLEIRVRDSKREPVGGVNITVFGRGVEPVSGLSSSAGTAVLGPFPPGLVLHVVATQPDGRTRAASSVRVRDGHDESVELTLAESGTIRGTVQDVEGRPVVRARVAIRLAGEGPLLGYATTDARGAFEFAGVPQAPLELLAEAASFETAEPTTLESPGRHASLQLKRRPSGVLRGRVTATDGDGVDGALVRLVPSGLLATTDSRGRFEIEGVPADESQRVLVAAPGLRVVATGGKNALVFAVQEGATHSINIAMGATESARRETPLAEAASIRAVAGRVVRRNGAPVAAARVGWAGIEAVTERDGRFRIDARDREATTIARPILVITPPVGLLEDLKLPLHSPDAEGLIELDEIGLRDRHSCRLSLTSTPGNASRSIAFVLLMDGADVLLGREVPPLASKTNVTYDGTWLHVARTGDWRAGGQRRGYVGVTGPTGPLAAWTDWPVSSGATLGVTPEWRDAIRKLVLKVPRQFVGGTAELRLRAAPEGIPIARMGLPLQVTLPISKTRSLIEPFLAGDWDITVRPPGGEDPGTRSLNGRIENGRVEELSPSR